MLPGFTQKLQFDLLQNTKSPQNIRESDKWLREVENNLETTRKWFKFFFELSDLIKNNTIEKLSNKLTKYFILY